MRFIDKNRTIPSAFGNIVQQVLGTPDHRGYNSLGKLRTPLLEILIKEQFGLCAYCNQQITASNSTVEHLVCQSHNPNFDLNYHNLFAVCKGNEGVKDRSHCDKHRANNKKNDYFLPFILFDQCTTTSWDQVNPFFDVKYNPKTRFLPGEIIPKDRYIDGFPSLKSRIQNAIDTLNLNAPILIEARRTKWESVLETKQKNGLDWQKLFDYYLRMNPLTSFHEFVLLAIRKQKL
jgi:uncharacterized protein (TIGR02646 family)